MYGDLLNKRETVMEENTQEGGGVAAMALLDYPLPPCPLFSAKWKHSKKKSKMLIRAGTKDKNWGRDPSSQLG